VNRRFLVKTKNVLKHNELIISAHKSEIEKSFMLSCMHAVNQDRRRNRARTFVEGSIVSIHKLNHQLNK
jgi:hypothetical protein